MKKRYLFIKIIPVLVVLMFMLWNIVKINVINTRALSPLGNAEENYDMAKSEFGGDFENFIIDNSYIKIYPEKDGQVFIKIGNKDFLIKSKLKDIKEFIENKIK
ncbi:hypothetical protein [Clostridium sp. BJN0001]|uniref:hypothetical protein n=1 Tax=Clostridium sp. BJN0001 TaxID=2930219 RepID=UPI001FD1098A|nr:hypothetical protein [Clostridium sp. BJN0001]